MSSVNKPPPQQLASISIIEDRLQVAVRAFILFAQGLFRARAPGDYHWDPNNEESELFIAGMEPEQKEADNKRPRIIVSRSAVSIGGTSIDQQLKPQWMGQAMHMTDLARFQVVISCSAREGLEAELLAWWIATRIMVFERAIQKVGRLHHIGTQGIAVSTETPVKRVVPGSPTPEWKTVRVSFPVALQEVVRAEKTGFYSQVVQYMLDVSGNS